MNLTFDLDGEGEILNTTVRDYTTGSVMYTIETPTCAEGALTTTVTGFNRTDGSVGRGFKILWKGKKPSLEGAEVMLVNGSSRGVPAREILHDAPGVST